MNNKIYTVTSKDGFHISIQNKKTKRTKSYHIREFVYGTIYFNDQVHKYPNYVHKKAWELYDLYSSKHYENNYKPNKNNYKLNKKK